MVRFFTALFVWVGERIRDFSMWPINLIRDFPVRIGRLFKTLRRAVEAVLFLLPELINAQNHHETGRWLKYKGGRLADWIHQLITQIFDLLGGPELGEFLIHFTTRTTPLSGDEIAMISSVLGPNALRFGDVRVVEGGLFDWIFKVNGNLAFATWHSINLPRTGQHTRENRPIVVHELTHVYQYEKVGSRYLGEAIYMLIKTKRDCYNYGGLSGLENACLFGHQYCNYNREQQAKITQDYFYYREKGANVSPFEPFIAQVRAGEL